MHATNPGDRGGHIYASNFVDVKAKDIWERWKIALHWKTRNRLFETLFDR